ncbi:MAG: acyltransferase [Lachnospiraceae bacterium]|nr:acyltransferase [Lachnospiraceae bacterium]
MDHNFNLGNKAYYFKSLQVLRAVALIMVYMFHQLLADEAFSRYGVCVFFILSGFLNAYHGYGRKQDIGLYASIKYGVTKVKRIFPLHIIMLTVAMALYIASNWNAFCERMPSSILESLIRYVTNLFLISSWIPHVKILDVYLAEYNIATWFLSDCLLFYVCTPLIISLMQRIYERRANRRYLPWIFIIIIYIYVIVLNLIFVFKLGYIGAFWYIYSWPLSRIGDYLIGMHLGMIFLRKEIDKPDFYFMLLSFSIMLSVVIIYLCTLLDIPENYIASSGFIFTVPVGGLVFALAGLDSRLTLFFSRYRIAKSFLWLGAISPYAYLIQVPVINAVHGVYERIGEVKMPIWCIISVFITLVVAVVYRNWMEKRERIRAK